MDLLIALALFLAAMLACLVRGWALYWALAFGLALFSAAGIRRGYAGKDIAKMAWSKMPSTMIVLRILFLIGILTGLWRSCGTIAFFICFGVRAISPPMFVLLAFALTVLLSYAMGTSFGVASTAGVVLMALARSGGVDPAVAAGAILSGTYFGDRSAPTSSCASLVAALTETDLYGNVKRMHRTALPAYLLCVAFYTVLSLKNPIAAADETLLGALETQFDLSPWTLLPALIMLMLPLARAPIWIAMTASLAAAFGVSVLVQHETLLETLRVCVLGCAPEGTLATVLTGGGLISMLSVFLMLPLASMMGGVLEGIGALDGVRDKLAVLSAKIGLLPTMGLMSILCSMVLCNQTIVLIMLRQTMGAVYEQHGASKEELATDMANSGVMIPGIVPWCIACAVPLSMLGVDVHALPYAALLYTIPICYLLTKKRYFRKGA